MREEEKPWQSEHQQRLEDHTWIWLIVIEIWKRQPSEPGLRSVLSTIWMTGACELMTGPPKVLDGMSASRLSIGPMALPATGFFRYFQQNLQ